MFRKVLKDAYSCSIPLSALFELTHLCNEKCIHCYVPQPHQAVNEDVDWIDALDQARDLGTLFVTFSGGDPLLHRDFFRIYEHAHQSHFAIRLFTNGLLLNDKHYDLFERRPPFNIQFSLYGHTAEIHDEVSRVPGSFDRTVAAIRRTVEMNLPSYAKCSWLRQNADFCQEIQEFATELGAIFRGNVSVVAPRGESDDTSVRSLRVTSEQLMRLVELNSKDTDQDIEQITEPGNQSSAHDSGFLCGAGIVTFRLTSSGNIYPCVQFDEPCGNILKQSLKDIWSGSSFLKNLRSLRKKDVLVCRTCDLKRHCNRCPAQARTEGDGLLACYPEARQLAKIRSEL